MPVHPRRWMVDERSWNSTFSGYVSSRVSWVVSLSSYWTHCPAGEAPLPKLRPLRRNPERIRKTTGDPLWGSVAERSPSLQRSLPGTA